VSRHFIILLILACSTIAFANQDKPAVNALQDVEKAVLEAHAKMIQAAESLDVEKFMDWILDAMPGPVIQDGRLMLTRQQAQDNVKSNYQGLAGVKYQLDRTYVKVISPEVALLAGEGTSTATLADGRTFSTPFALSEVFVLREGKWKVLHAHQSVPNNR